MHDWHDLTQKSITRIVISVFVTATILLLTVFGAIKYKVIKDQNLAKFSIERRLKAEQLATGVAVSAWNFDGLQIDRIMESVMKDQSIYGVVVSEKKKNMSWFGMSIGTSLWQIMSLTTSSCSSKSGQ